MLELLVRGRNNLDVQILWGVEAFDANPSAKKLIEDVWRNGMFAEYTRSPLANCML